MGQQQLLTIVLGALIVGMTVAGAIRVVDQYRMDDVRGRVRQEAILLAQYAEEYRLRPTRMGGGGGSYTGFQLPKFFIDEPDIGYWVVGSGQNLQVYACSWGAAAIKGNDGVNPVAVFVTRTAPNPAVVSVLN